MPAPVPEVFAFLADAANLPAVMPAFLSVHVLTPLPVEMRVGTRLAYRLRLHHVSLRWESEFTVWDPPHRFAYEQRRGPFRSWYHEHTFTESRGGGTAIRDLVRYGVPGGRIVDLLVVRPDLERLFTHRAARLGDLLGG